MQNFTHYVLKKGEPFKGNCQTVSIDGVTVYTYSSRGSISKEEYEKENGFEVEIIPEAEFLTMYGEYIESRVTEPRKIDKDRYWYLLEVLPPCRWKTVRGVELFHVSERLQGELVTWCAKLGDKYFEFEDLSYRNMEELAAKVAKAANR